MDLSMPVMDGLEASRRLRAMGILTPIVALTADITAENSDRLADHGIDGCLLKPASFGRLQSVIMAMLNPPPSAPPPANATADVLDPSKLEQLKQELDEAIVAQIVAAAVGDIRSYGAVLLQPERHSPEEVRRAAHTLAGVSASIGAVQLEPIVRAIEHQGLQAPEAAELAPAIERALAALASRAG
jgi:CheY-like chemotaxis protein